MYKNKLINLSLSALFTAVIVICGLITVPAPVPFTLQTLGVFSATLFLGSKGGFWSVLAYILLGTVGMPVFSGFLGGVGVLFGPTGGYILGFLFIPLATGLLCRFFSKKQKTVYCFIGLILCYVMGSVWYTIYTDAASFLTVLTVGVIPFVLPDVVKLLLAAKISHLLSLATKRFIGDTGKLSGRRIRRKLSEEISVFTYEEIDSTNTEAVRKIREGTKLPALFVAEKQTAGRGRRGKSFYSLGGVYMTLAMPSSEEFDTVRLTTKAAVAVAEAIEELTGKRVGIKWVNDIYLDNKKICGILCEAVTDPENGTTVAHIVGVGVNLNVKDFPDELLDIAGSLECSRLSGELLAAKITEKLFKYLRDGQEYIASYKKRSIVIGKEIRYIKNGAEYTAKALDIDQNGGLLVENPQGTELLTSGEISLRLK